MTLSQVGCRKLILICLSILSPSLYAVDEIINTPIKIDSTDQSFENKSIVIDGAKVIINGVHNFTSLKIINNGVVTHDEEQRLELNVEQKIEILSGGIDASEKGLLADVFASALSGGSHIGYGGAPLGAVAGIAFGSFKSPITAGRGGRSSSVFIDASNSTRGGGTVILKADELILNGNISSRGQDAYSLPISVGGAAGGTVAIDVRKITGNGGTIYTHGGVGKENTGSGSGGIISIKYQEALESSSYGEMLQGIQMSAWGGYNGTYRGATGSIYIENKITQKGKLFVQGFPYYQGPFIDEKEYFRAKTFITELTSDIDLVFDRASVLVSDSDPKNIKISNGCKAGKAVVEFAQNVSITGIDANCEKGVYLGFQRDLHLLLPRNIVSSGITEIDVLGSLTSEDSNLSLTNSKLGLHKPHNFNTIELKSNSVLSSGFPAAYTNVSLSPVVLDINAQSVLIDPTSAIDVSGNGLVKKLEKCTSYGHGGKGKDINSEIYGNHDEPTSFGTGCASNDGKNLLFGGGALRLTASNLLLDGAIRANADGAIGGSGGSVWLDIENLQRTASIVDPQIITANGRADGGGGRIFIISRNVQGLDLKENVFAQGYSAGTVYIKEKDNPAVAKLIVKNALLNPNALTGANLLIGDELTVSNANLEIQTEIPLEDIPRSLVEGATLVFSNPVTIEAGFVWPSLGKFKFKNGLHLNEGIHGIDSLPLKNLSILVSGRLSSNDNNLIVNGYKLEITNDQEFEKIELLNGGSITSPRAASASQPPIELNADEILIDGASKIDVTGKGLSFDPTNEELDGGSHGGIGGINRYFSDNAPSYVHGSAVYPTSYGYGAKIAPYGGPTYGGGAIKIKADVLTLDGKIIADGEAPYAANMGGGAAGGSILLDVDVLKSSSGNFVVSASGGNGVGYAGAGGGGRIAIYYNSLDNIDFSKVKAFGGAAESSKGSHGGAGTIYLEDKTNSLNKEMRIIGQAKYTQDRFTNDCYYPFLCPKTAVPLIPDNTSLIVGYTHFYNPSDLNAKSISFNNSNVTLGNLNTKTLDADHSSIYFIAGNREINIGESLHLKNWASVTFPEDIENPFDVSLSGESRATFKNATVKNLSVSVNSSLEVNDLFVEGSLSNVGGEIGVSGNIHVSGATSIKSNASDVRIRSVDLPNAYLSSDLTLVENDQSLLTRFRLIYISYSDVAFESIDRPGHYLRYTDSGLVLAPDDNSPLFKAQTTFQIEKGLSDPLFTSFQSAFSPGAYLKHVGNLLTVAPVGTAEHQSATWNTGLEINNNSGSILVRFGDLKVNGNAIFEQPITGDTRYTSKVTVGGQLRTSSADLVVDGIDLSLSGRHSFKDIHVKNAASLSVIKDNSIKQNTQYAGLELLADKVFVASDSLINVSGTSQITAYGQYTGGSHGGKGGRQSGVGAQLQGVEQQPVTKGAPGRADSFTCNTLGGGALKLTTDLLELSGKILANGDAGSSSCGAGAGGSVWLIAGTIQSPIGAGEVHADGGLSAFSGRGSGGGGRVALYYNTNSGLDFSKVTAKGGTAVTAQDKGDNGTVYLKTGSVPPYVSGHSLPQSTNNPFSSFKLTFSAGLDLPTLNVNNIAISRIDTPLNISRPSLVEALSDTEFVIHFSSPFGHGDYQLTVDSSVTGKNGLGLDQNRNLISGEAGDVFSVKFAVDTEAPAAPVLQAYPETHNINKYLFAGSKEAGSAVLLNGNLVVTESAATTWSFNTSLTEGLNQLNFTVRDKAGNTSSPAVAQIKYDDRAPGPVTITGIDGRGQGSAIYVSWLGYDREANGGDISKFELYCSTSPFSSVNGMYPCTTGYAHENYTYIHNLSENTQYYVAVVAVDTSGLRTTNVTPSVVTTVDTVAPRISNLSVVSGLNSLELTWYLEYSSADLREYQIFYISQNQPKTIVVGKQSGNKITYLLTGLEAGNAHSVRVSAVDETGNMSTLTDPGVTLLPNPQNVKADAHDESADIQWASVNSNQLLKHYAVYVQNIPFNDVTGLTPKMLVPVGLASESVMSTVITGLTNDVKYYVAVTAVNLSNGEAKQVTPVSVTPQNDSDGPEIISAEYIVDETTLSLDSSPTLNKSGGFAIKATDKSKMSRVVFTLNGEPLGNVLITNPQGAYEQAIDLLSIADGNYTLGVKAYDMLENVTERNYPFLVDLIAPTVPTIIAPAQNTTINQTSIQLSGKSVAGTEVVVAVNGTDLAEIITVDSSGNYSTMVNLVEGANKLEAKARYLGRSKWSAFSAERNITVNTQIPDAPKGFSVTAAKQGQVHLQWSPVTSSNANNQVKGYKIYRSASAFTATTDTGVSAINNGQLVTTTNFTNTVAVDGSYFYAVAAVNQANNEGALSNVLSTTVDSIGPKITQLTFTTEGEFDAATNTFGRGRVLVSATFSEPLRNAPYFAVVPEAGLPISIDLAKSYSDELVYTGQFTIDQATASGTAYATMSAFDNIGNRGTDIQQNASLKIDTQGPDIAQLSVAPAEPLKVDSVNGLHVNVSIRLSEETKAGTQVKLVPMIDGSPLSGFDQGITLIAGADNLSFAGEFDLPNTVAQSSSTQLSFTHAAVDGLNNPSQKIIGQNQFQVYQGNLPPLNTPGDLTATALPGGKIKLNWRAVDKAAAYALYRQGPNDSQLTALPQLTAIEYEDQTIEDGTYLYAVASVRRDNGQETESSQSATVSVKADRIAPAKAENLALELNGAGIVARWSAPVVDALGAPQVQQGLTYKLYRTALPQNAEVTDASAYTPIQTRIPALIALDTKPAADQHSYFVVAVDAAGNESVPSATAYLNAGLLPVNQLFITLDNNGYPQLSWQHQGNGIESYRVLRKTGTADAELLTPEAIAHTATNSSYTDTTYNSNQASKGAAHEVVYSVIAVDEHDVESVPHELRLPALSVKLERNKAVVLERGVMNQLLFRVDNKGTTAADAIRLYVTLTENGTQREHVSEIFNVAAGANQLVPVVVGGYDKLDAITDLSLRLEQKPQTNQRIRIQQTEAVDVGTSSLTLDLSTQNFTRGGTGKVSFNLTNNSDVETELVMATNNSNADSTEVRLILEDLQGNLLSQKAIRQTTGGVINVPSGQTVARVAPKAIFSSQEFTLNVPAAAPDQVRLRLVVDKYHYQLGKENHVAISGIGVSKDIQLNDTPYFAVVTDVQPARVNAKNGTVTISGRAVDRATNAPLANVPVSIVTSVRGFERVSTVYADASGNYVFVYKVDGTAGKYRVSAIHPEMTDRPNQGEFIAEGGSVSPADITLKIPRNYEQKIPLKISAGFDTTLNNVRLVQLPSGSEAVASLPTGVSANYTPLTSVSANSSQELVVKFVGDNSAEETGVITYRVEADGHTEAKALGYVTINYKLAPASPAVTSKPQIIDTGVAHEQARYEDLRISNTGLDLLRNARVELVPLPTTPEVPQWVSLTTATDLGDLAVGEARDLQLLINPDASVSEGVYQVGLQVVGDNYSGLPSPIPVFIKVTQSGVGKIAFKVTDIYTKTRDGDNVIIEGVDNARIQLQNENVLSIVTNKNTNNLGEVIFEELPAGRYAYRISARDHTSISGRVWIKPGVTSFEKAFLMNTLVNVEWAVREITIEDRYEIKLEATFKTHVPVALVMMEPLHVNLPVMKKGQVFQGEVTLTNHGLIRADNVRHMLPQNSEMVRFEFMKEIPMSLSPAQVFVLPYKIYALRDFNPAGEALATGGGCGSFGATTAVTYTSTCEEGTVVPGSASLRWYANWGACVSSGSAGGTYISGGGGGWSWGGAASPISSQPQVCGSDDPNDNSCDQENAAP